MIKLLNYILLFFFRFYFWMINCLRCNRLFNFFQKALNYNYLRYHGVETKFGYVNLVGFPLIRRYPNSKIIIEKNVTLVSKSEGNVAGVNHPVILATLAADASITLKKGCGLSGSSVCATNSIIISENSGLGVNTCVYDTDFHSTDRKTDGPGSILDAKAKPISIGKKAWIGANSIILKGVSIGEGAVIGAGSVVRTDIDRDVVALGNPAKVTRKI